MPTREQVARVLAGGRDYAAAGRALGIAPGQAYLIMTGMPADGGEQPRPGDEPEGYLTSPQHLVYPAVENPTARAVVHRWMAQRAAEERA